MQNWEEQLEILIDYGVHQISDIAPSDWAELHMVIKDGKYQGPLSYDLTPFFKEAVDCMSPYHWATRVAWMGAAQMGKSKAFIEAAIAFLISEHPCKILYLTGHTELSEESMQKLDNAIDNAGLRPLIYKQSLNKKNSQTGDTLKKKEFPNGELIAGSATNHNMLRQRDPRVVIVDDCDAANKSSSKTGSTISLIEKRTNSYGKDKKVAYISTPQLKNTSIVYEVYKEGDMRWWEIPCPCCGTMIDLKWENFAWDWDGENMIHVPGSVRYVCQSCHDHFDETHKHEWNLAGQWRSTLEPGKKPKDPLTVSFWLPGWYAAVGMDDWDSITRDYLKACPPGQPINRSAYQTWLNVTAGWPYEADTEETKAGDLQKKNVNNYNVGTIPESLSVKNGNGRIVLVTCAADMNGILENGRLDYEVKGWCENGSAYSIVHGSIGTFKPAVLRRKSDNEDQTVDWWTYEENKPLCIWTAFEKIITQQFPVDVCDGEKPRNMNIGITVLDVGHLKTHAFTFIDKMVNKGIFVQGVKGKGEGEYSVITDGLNTTELDKRVITKGRETDNLWVLEVGYIKDKLKTLMQLNWRKDVEDQPSGYMNFPQAQPGVYQWECFFEHYESEKPVLVSNKTETNVIMRWQKKTVASQNHFWDCCVYGMAAKEIWIIVLREKYSKAGAPPITWATYVDATLKMRGLKGAA